MKDKAYIPNRGDAVWITLNPQAGHQQSGRRTAVILSPEVYNGKVGLAILCPITNKLKGYPFEVLIPSDVAVGGAILSDQVKSMDWRAREAELICKLPENTVAETLQKLSLLLL